MADPARQYQLLRDEINTILANLLASGQYIGGEQVAHFEQELAIYLGLPSGGVVSCANGTDALELAYRVVGLEAGDEVIMPSFNYVASAESAVRLGLVPIWADVMGCGEQMYNIEVRPSELETLLSERTRALVGVNLYGHPIEAQMLRTFAHEHGLILIEDNAQGLGGKTHNDVSLGALGDIATTSFFPTKPLGCMGDGGALMTANAEWAARARSLANHGQSCKYNYHYVGMNSRLDALQAAVLRVKLRYLDEFVSSTRRIAEYYMNELEDLPELELPSRTLLTTSTFHQFTCLLSKGIDRDRVMTTFRDHGIQLQLYYPAPIHSTLLYATLGVQRSDLEQTEYLSKRMLSLPIFPLMTLEEAREVLDVFKLALKD